MAIRYAVLSAPSLRGRLQVLSKRLFEVDATPRNLPPLVAVAAKYINDAGFLFDGSSDGRDRWPADWEFLWPFNLNDRWLLQWLDLSKDVDYARNELGSPTAEVDRDTVLAWMQAAFASHLQQWLSQCVPGMSLNPGSAFVPSEWRGTHAFRKYHWKHQGNLAASAVLIGPSKYQQFADDVATVCAYLAEQLTAWLAVTESPAPIAPAFPSPAAPSSGTKPVDAAKASKTEGTVSQGELPTAPAKPKKPTVVADSKRDSYISIGTDRVQIDYDHAVYLKALIETGDWLSDPEFRKSHPVYKTDRQDRLRKKLPRAVAAHIETTSRGSRWVDAPMS